MSTSVKTLARCALFTALGVALNYLASVLPLASLAIVAAAGLLTAATVIHAGLPRAFAVFAVTAALSLLLAGDKSAPLLYAAFLGYYPALKSFLERRLRPHLLCWAVKLLLFNAAFAALYLLASQILLSQLNTRLPWLAIQGLGNLVFVIYDIGLSRLIGFYIRRISTHIKS